MLLVGFKQRKATQPPGQENDIAAAESDKERCAAAIDKARGEKKSLPKEGQRTRKRSPRKERQSPKYKP